MLIHIILCILIASEILLLRIELSNEQITTDLTVCRRQTVSRVQSFLAGYLKYCLAYEISQMSSIGKKVKTLHKGSIKFKEIFNHVAFDPEIFQSPSIKLLAYFNRWKFALNQVCIYLSSRKSGLLLCIILVRNSWRKKYLSQSDTCQLESA